MGQRLPCPKCQTVVTVPSLDARATEEHATASPIAHVDVGPALPADTGPGGADSTGRTAPKQPEVTQKAWQPGKVLLDDYECGSHKRAATHAYNDASLAQKEVDEAGVVGKAGPLLAVAERGEAVAQLNLGIAYRDGNGCTKDYAEAMKWLRKSAGQGNSAAQAAVGHLYECGWGVPQDLAEAVAWYRKAAEGGDPNGQNNLGLCYQNGKGVPQDLAQAVAWYRKAAEGGGVDGQVNLGFCYDNGLGVPQDFAQAVLWYRKAAEQGHLLGQNNLGVCYQNGRGVPQDFGLAVAWYRKAADGGNPIAKNNLQSLNWQQTPFILKLIGVLVVAWLFSLAGAVCGLVTAFLGWGIAQMLGREMVLSSHLLLGVVLGCLGSGITGSLIWLAFGRRADQNLSFQLVAGGVFLGGLASPIIGLLATIWVGWAVACVTGVGVVAGSSIVIGVVIRVSRAVATPKLPHESPVLPTPDAAPGLRSQKTMNALGVALALSWVVASVAADVAGRGMPLEKQPALIKYGITLPQYSDGILPVQLLTYSFIHLANLHLVVNLLCLWCLVSLMRNTIAPRTAVGLYCLGCSVGAAMYLLVSLPMQNQLPLVGAGTGLATLLGALAVVKPHEKMLLFYIIPCTLRGMTWIFGVITVIVIPVPPPEPIAMLSGLFTGLVVMRKRGQYTNRNSSFEIGSSVTAGKRVGLTGELDRPSLRPQRSRVTIGEPRQA